MNFYRTLLLAGPGSLALSVLAVAGQQTPILQQTFSAANRTLQSLPDSVAWFVSETEGVNTSGKGLVSSPNRHALAYFAEAGQPVSLSVGESIEVELVFSVRDPERKGGVFRIALLDSGGKKRADDGAGAANPLFRDYKGYAAFLDFDAPTALSLYRRRGDSEKLISGNEAFGDALLRGGGTGGKLEGNTLYTAKFRLTRTAGGVDISGEIPELEGYVAKIVDSDNPVTAFDTVVVYGARSGMSRFTLDQIKILK